MATSTDDLTAAAARLIVARDDGECVVGRPDRGIYVDVPAAGAAFVEALQAGATLHEATARASEIAGEPVDGEDFVAALTDAGLLDPAGATGPDGPAAPVRGRPIRWIEGVSPRAAQLMFGRTAWLCYGAAALLAAGLLIAYPSVRPTFEHLFFLDDPILSILVYLPVSLVLSATHEAWHWLAGRAIGVPATFRVSHRGIFLVFETDLTQIVAVPRRRRYGPFFAGMAFDVCVLATALLLRVLYQHSVITLPPALYRLLGAVALGQFVAIIWQWFAVFLRSDVYAALANALRCQNLYRITWLTVKDRLWPLTTAQQEELAGAAPRDRVVARWFGLVYMAGVGGMCWTFLTFAVPSMISTGTWLAGNLSTHSAASAAFWEAVAVAVCLAVFWGGPAVSAWRERRLRRAGAPR